MRKKPEQEGDEQQHDLEILKAVAQAWHGHSSINSNSTSRQTSEFDAHRMNFKSRPSRFKLEAMSKPSSSAGDNAASWDFGQSLWDSYEIVTVSKKLEAGLVLDDHQFFAPDGAIGSSKRRRESKNSLRNLLNRMSSRRFSEVDVPDESTS
ncbi:hypothetical protein RJ639_030326 [Escallonia herrerae]|uniref:Uncharacterized protein n=1 Tax=Escallonia herrerae TaxID=1293975 RepID=A0AA88X080_9ASTE|nr:hypothetical protein RJ639_030326 [Escallonia herrerae]